MTSDDYEVSDIVLRCEAGVEEGCLALSFRRPRPVQLQKHKMDGAPTPRPVVVIPKCSRQLLTTPNFVQCRKGEGGPTFAAWALPRLK